MEENLNLDAAEEIAEEQADDPAEDGAKQAVPTREEILAASRKENKNGDEREIQWYARASALAMSAGLLIAGIIIMITAFVKDYVPCEIMMIVTAMQAVQQLTVGIKVKRKMRKTYLILGSLFAVLAVVFLVLWILQLCGVGIS